MADLTWCSREGADQRFLTKTEASGLASEEESTQGDVARSGRIDAVKATAEAALPSATAAATYATKAELAQAQLGGGGQAPDLSGFATKTEMRQADAALGVRIDGAATKAELGDYLKKTDATSTYATKTELEQVKNQQGGGSPAPPPAPAGPVTTVWNGTDEIGVAVTVWDGATEIPATIEIQA